MCIPTRLVHLCRTVSPDVTEPLVRLVDRAVFFSAMAILGQPAADPDADPAAAIVRLRLHLPVALGGMGFMRLTDVVRPAFVGSWALCGEAVAKIATPALPPIGPEHTDGLPGALGALKARVGSQAIATLRDVTTGSLLGNDLGPEHDGGAQPAAGGAHIPVPEDGDDEARDASVADSRRKPAPASQVAIMLEINRHRQQEILDALTLPQAKAAFVSGAGTGAGAWVTACCTGDRALADVDFRWAAALRLGLNIHVPSVEPAVNGLRQCKACGKDMDMSGSHAFVCKTIGTSGVQSTRHHGIVNVILATVYQDPHSRLRGLNGSREVPVAAVFPPKPDAPEGFIRADISESVRDKPQHKVVLDVTVTHPQAAKILTLTTIEGQGAAAAAAEKVKDTKYGKFHAIPEGGLVPIALETYGTMGKRGDRHLRKLVRDFVRPVEWLDAPPDGGGPKFVDHGGRYSIFLRRLREHISVKLQRGNADFIRRWIQRCVPCVGAPVVDEGAHAAGA